MNQYEALYIIAPAQDEETMKASVEKFKGIVATNGGEVTAVDEWGKKRLAYPINYKTEGYYVLINFESGPDAPIEIDRQMRINDGIVRQMITKKV